MDQSVDQFRWLRDPAAAIAREPAALVRRVYDGKLFPDLQIELFRNADRLFPVRAVLRGDIVSPLGLRTKQISDITFESKGQAYDLFDLVSRNCITGLLVLDHSHIALEYYAAGNTDRTRWLSMSMAKSISTTLAGAAIRDGLIAGLDAPLTDYLPQLHGGAYDSVTVQQLLEMNSGVQWYESYTDPASDRRRMLELQIAQEPGAILKQMAALPRAAAPGTKWNYSTGETHVLGELVRAATGQWLSDYLSEKLWRPLGMESDAWWWLEAPDGLEVAGSGFGATLRDYGRFGLFMMNDGVIQGVRVLPENWVVEAGASRNIGGQNVDYGFMWWPVHAPKGQPEGFRAGGIFGQRIYINPQAQVVIVVWSARSKPMGAEGIDDNDFFNAVVRMLA